MAKLGSFEVEGNIVVTKHALEQALVRAPELATCYTADQQKRYIKNAVAGGIAKGLVYDRKPKNFRINTHGGDTLPWQRYVVSPSQTMCWIVSLDAPPDVVVVTTLIPLNSPGPKSSGRIPQRYEGR